MASHESSKKSIRKTAKQRVINVSRISRIKTFIKKFEATIANGADVADIKKSFTLMQKEIMKGAAKHVVHKNAASRKISRMALKLKAAVASK